jgi:hypothetical protein
MSTTPSAPPPAPPARTATAPPEPNEITIVSHSNLFYWWPVWAVGFLMAILTYLDNHYMAIVPAHTEAVRDAKIEGFGKGGKVEVEGRDAIVLPKGRHLDLHDPLNPNSYPAEPRLHIAKRASYGVLFAAVLLLVIVITNVPLRGMWSVVVIITIILVSIIFGLAGWWETILRTLHLLDIRINAAGYILLSGVLLGIWVVTLMFFDRQIYIVFTPRQLKVCTEIGGGEKVYDTMGMKLEKHRSDLFRHWVLGLGSGDLTVRTAGAGGEHIELPNVLFIGKKVRLIEEMMQRQKVVETRG